MRILLAAKHPPGGSRPIGGVQSWSETVGAQLRRLGHEAVFWGPEFDLPSGRFDIGLFANWSHTKAAEPLCDRSLSISHGVIEDERPAPGLACFTSEEVMEHWRFSGPIVRQPIDLEFWSPLPEARERKLLLLFYSYRAPSTFGLADLAHRLGLGFDWVRNVAPTTARDAMRSAALVCASGRAALEAMACGAPTLICDWRPYNGGPLFEPNAERARRSNYSGRSGIDPRTIYLPTYAEASMAQDPRRYVEEHHNAQTIVGQLMGYACFKS